MKLHFITNLPAPYKLACFAEAARLGADFHVTFERVSDAQRRWEETLGGGRFPFTVMAPGRLRRLGQWLAIGFGRGGFPVHGNYSAPGAVMAIFLHILLFRRFGIWSASTLDDWRPDSALNRCIKRIMFSRAAVVFCPGVSASAHARAFGARRIAITPNCIDTDAFAADLAAADMPRGDGPRRLVYIGRLSPEKDIVTAIRALKDLPGDVVLRIVGFGPEEAHLRAEAERSGVAARVDFVGYKDGVDLAREYAGAEIMVLPSKSEPWGLVVNEAMQAGAIAVVARGVGCVPDLIDDGVTGCLFDTGDADDLSRVLAALLDDPGKRDALRRAAREHIARFTPIVFARALVDGARKAVDG